MQVAVQGESISNYFFQYFSKAFQKGDRAICFHHGIVLFVRLRDDSDFGGRPGVVV